MPAWAVLNPAPTAAAPWALAFAAAPAMAMAAACATFCAAPAVDAATMADASGTLPPTSGRVLAMAWPTLLMALSASKVAIASVPFKPMRNRDTSLPHSFQVEVAAFILLFHQSRCVLPSMPTAASGSAPALVAAAIFCPSTLSNSACGTR
ncbi:hypothetical protein D3C81_1679210 [compost metagenome]